MAKKYTGSLSLEWFNKQKSILVQTETAGKANGDVPSPKMTWVNKDDALFYEIVDEEGRGLSPYWVDHSDLRVKEARPLLFQKTYKVVEYRKADSLIHKEYKLVEDSEDDVTIKNILIRGDNLLSLNALKKLFANRPEEEKVKCIYIDPPYNSGAAFEQYDDNLGHSEWLTLIRDRLAVLHGLLRRDGFIFVQMDNREAFRLKILLDEVFGEDNFINDIIWKRRGGSANPVDRLNNVTDYILWYRKSAESRIEQIFSLDDENTKEYIEQRFVDTDESGRRFYKTSIGSPNPRPNLRYEYKGYSPPPNGWSISRELMEKWDSLGKLYFPDDKSQRIYRKIYLDEYQGQPISNLWTDIKVINSMSKERADFDGQKPEALVQRIIKLTTQEGDLVLDCFGGSGTTFAVAHKMNRRWIGIEIGKHAETHIIPRLKNVLTGQDESGISKAVNWCGGGGFKYYILGGSIIDRSTRDFNWMLGRDFIEESLLSSYDFVPDTEFSFPQIELVESTQQPSIGFHRIGPKQLACVVTLVEPNMDKPLTYDECMAWYDALKKFKGTQSIMIFTNRGVELAYDSKPEDLEIIKVPHAIFAELEK
jgi:DNA modification methylase